MPCRPGPGSRAPSGRAGPRCYLPCRCSRKLRPARSLQQRWRWCAASLWQQRSQAQARSRSCRCDDGLRASNCSCDISLCNQCEDRSVQVPSEAPTVMRTRHPAGHCGSGKSRRLGEVRIVQRREYRPALQQRLGLRRQSLGLERTRARSISCPGAGILQFVERGGFGL